MGELPCHSMTMARISASAISRSDRVLVVGSVVVVVDEEVVDAVVAVDGVSGRVLTSPSPFEQALAKSTNTRRDAASRPMVAAMAVMLLLCRA